MPGTLVRDANETDLIDGATLTAAGTTQSTIVDLQYPQTFGIYIDTGTITGTSPTLDVEIEASSSSTFASDVTTIGQVPTVGDDDDATAGGLVFYSNKRYIRAQVVVGGTSPDFSGTVFKIVEPHYLRSDTTDGATN